MIDRVITTPMDKLRFRDFIGLRSGRDSFSRLRLPTLREMVSRDDAERAAEEWPDDESEQAKCLRWILRGLPLDKAIRKVKTDAQVRANAIAGKESPAEKRRRNVSNEDYNDALERFCRRAA